MKQLMRLQSGLLRHMTDEIANSEREVRKTVFHFSALPVAVSVDRDPANAVESCSLNDTRGEGWSW